MQNNVEKEYSQALFTLACEENSAEKYYEELKLVSDVFRSDTEYLTLLSSPNLSMEEKISCIDGAFSSFVSEYTLSFLKLLCEKGHISRFDVCLDDYEKLYNLKCRTRVARVISSVELTDEEKAKIKASLEKKWKVTVNLACETDESILGGIIIETEDTVIDGSLKSKLRDVKDVIKA